METIKDRYITIQMVAEILTCKERHIYDLIVSGSLKAIKVGSRAVRISQQSLMEFIDGNRVNPDDFFDPDLEKQDHSEQKQVIRSNWMAKG